MQINPDFKAMDSSGSRATGWGDSLQEIVGVVILLAIFLYLFITKIIYNSKFDIKKAITQSKAICTETKCVLLIKYKDSLNEPPVLLYTKYTFAKDFPIGDEHNVNYHPDESPSLAAYDDAGLSLMEWMLVFVSGFGIMGCLFVLSLLLY